VGPAWHRDQRGSNANGPTCKLGVNGALEVLERTGAEIHSDEALHRLVADRLDADTVASPAGH